MPRLSCRSGRVSLRHCALAAGRNAAIVRAARASLWICGQRKRVAHRPTGSANSRQYQFECSGTAELTLCLSHPNSSQSEPPRHVTIRLRHLCADPGSQSHLQLKCLKSLARPRGFEPLTFAFGGAKVARYAFCVSLSRPPWPTGPRMTRVPVRKTTQNCYLYAVCAWKSPAHSD